MPCWIERNGLARHPICSGLSVVWTPLDLLIRDPDLRSHIDMHSSIERRVRSIVRYRTPIRDFAQMIFLSVWIIAPVRISFAATGGARIVWLRKALIPRV